MISRTFELDPEYKPPTNAMSPPSSADDLDSGFERPTNSAGMAVVGVLLFLIGVAMATVSGTVGGGILLIAFLMILGSIMIKRWEEAGDLSLDVDSQWDQATNQAYEDLEYDSAADEYLDYQQRRQREIDEIVKAVKATIRVRCRYCGTLNEEKANKCESCGASL